MGFIIDPERWASINEYSETVHFRDASIKRVEEFEANEFAASFLMPRNDFLQAVNEHSNRGFCYTKRLSEIFQVSEEAVKLRGKFLGVFEW